MDPLILDYIDVQLEVEVSGPEPSTSAASPPPPTAAPHMLAPALTTNNHLSSLLLKDPTLQVQQQNLYSSYCAALDSQLFTSVIYINYSVTSFILSLSLRLISSPAWLRQRLPVPWLPTLTLPGALKIFAIFTAIPSLISRLKQ
jgi:hypothetical protein